MTGAARALEIALVLLVCAGCSAFGPSILETSRLQYNEVVKKTAEEQLLLNIVRLRYTDTPSSLAVSAIALHNLREPEKIFACYRAIHDLLKPAGCFLNCDRFVEGIDPHLGALREAGFDRVECPWREAPRAILIATRIGR